MGVNLPRPVGLDEQAPVPQGGSPSRGVRRHIRAVSLSVAHVVCTSLASARCNTKANQAGFTGDRYFGQIRSLTM